MCVGLHLFYQEAKGELTVEKITCRWLFVCDQKFPTGFLSDREAKTKQRQQSQNLKTVCLPRCSAETINMTGFFSSWEEGGNSLGHSLDYFFFPRVEQMLNQQTYTLYKGKIMNVLTCHVLTGKWLQYVP